MGIAENRGGIAENRGRIAGVAENRGGIAENRGGIAENRGGIAENRGVPPQLVRTCCLGIAHCCGYALGNFAPRAQIYWNFASLVRLS